MKIFIRNFKNLIHFRTLWRNWQERLDRMDCGDRWSRSLRDWEMAEIQTYSCYSRVTCHLLPDPAFYQRSTSELQPGLDQRQPSRGLHQGHSHHPNSVLCAVQCTLRSLAVQRKERLYCVNLNDAKSLRTLSGIYWYDIRYFKIPHVHILRLSDYTVVIDILL